MLGAYCIWAGGWGCWDNNGGAVAALRSIIELEVCPIRRITLSSLSLGWSYTAIHSAVVCFVCDAAN
jgi:hypothetical protein